MFVNLASSGNTSSLNMALQIRHWRIITDVPFYLHTLKYISNGISLSDTLDSTCLYIVNSGVGANDELIGGGGKDLLSGDNGNDELTDGIGPDRFDYGAGKDKITHFNPSEGDIKSTNCEQF